MCINNTRVFVEYHKPISIYIYITRRFVVDIKIFEGAKIAVEVKVHHFYKFLVTKV